MSAAVDALDPTDPDYLDKRMILRAQECLDSAIGYWTDLYGGSRSMALSAVLRRVAQEVENL